MLYREELAKMKRPSLRPIHGICIIFLVLSALFVPLIPLADAQGALIFVDPPSITGPLPGDQFGVDLYIMNVWGDGVHAWEVELLFDKKVLNVFKFIEGDFLMGGGFTTFNYYIDNPSGFAMCGATGDMYHYGVWGEGILATVIFEVVGGGSSPIDIYEIDLFDRDKNPLPHTADDGYFQGMAPYAKFTYSPSPISDGYSPAANQTITFDAGDSYDPDGTITNYHWDWGDGTTPDDTASTVIGHVFTQPSVAGYIVNLTATDDEGYEESYDSPVIVVIRDVAVTGLDVSPENLVRPAYMVEINVTVHNYGTFKEGYNLAAYYDDTLIDEVSRPDLNSDTNETLTFNLDTTGFANGTYIIKANVTSVFPGDNNLTNNEASTPMLIEVGWIDGTVIDAETLDPIVGATVEADDNFATADVAGHYKIELPSGDYIVNASMTGYIPQLEPAHVNANETTTAVNFALEPVTHTLEVISDPTGIDFIVDDTSHTTPWLDSLPERTHTIVMPPTWGIYDFDHWENSSTNPTRTVSLNADKIVTAYYVKRQWTLNVNSNPIDGVEFTVDDVTHTTPWSVILEEGSYTVVMPSTWTVGTDVYNFDQWEDDSTDRTRVVTLTSDTTITAHYAKEFTLTVNSSPITDIDFTIDGLPYTTDWSDPLLEATYTIIMPMTWTTLGGDVYQFDNWEDDSINPTRLIDLTADKTITAYYVYVPVVHKITVDSDPTTGIEFKIDGATQITPWMSDLAEDSYTIIMPSTWDVYNFDHWDDMSTDPNRTISLTSDKNVTAHYVIRQWNLTVDSDPITEINFTIDGATQTTAWSSLLDEGSYAIVMPSEWTVGTNVYNFDQWEDGSTNATHTISLTANTTVTATYKLYVALVASFTFSPTEPIVAQTVTFNASASYDPDGEIVSYFWNFGDETNDTGEIVEHAYTTAGTYTVTLTVTDNDTLTDSASANITISSALQPPVASFNYSPESPLVNGTVTFDASASYDPDGTITIYSWNFDDGDTGTGETPTHVYTTGGTYTVTLTVTDNDGLTATTTRSVYVTGGKLSSSVSITVSPTAITIGEGTIIIGFITPARVGANVTIESKVGEDDWSNITTVTTIQWGAYLYTWTPTAVGTYQLRARWLGDSITYANVSDVKTVTVKEMFGTISLGVTPASVSFGSSVVIVGKVEPERPGVWVYINVRKNGGDWTLLLVMITDSKGNYSYEWTPTDTGTYELQAMCKYDIDILGSESEIRTITVKAVGVPLDIYIYAAFVATTIILAGVLAVFFFRKRKT